MIRPFLVRVLVAISILGVCFLGLYFLAKSSGLPIFRRDRGTSLSPTTSSGQRWDFEEENLSPESRSLPAGWSLVGQCRLGEGLNLETVSGEESFVSGAKGLKVTAAKGCGISREIIFDQSGFSQVYLQVKEITGKAEAVLEGEDGHLLASAFFTESGGFQLATIPIPSGVKKGRLTITSSTSLAVFIVDDIRVQKEDAVPSNPVIEFDSDEVSSTGPSTVGGLVKPIYSAGSFTVRPVYFVPSDMEVHSEYLQGIASAMAAIRSWCSRELYGATFEQSATIVWRDGSTYDQLRCGGNPDCLQDPGRTDNYDETIHRTFPKQSGRVDVIFLQGGGGIAFGSSIPGVWGMAVVGDWVLIPASGGFICPRCIDCYGSGYCSYNKAAYTVGHELGHAFGLPHSCQYDNQLGPPHSIMCAANYPECVLYDSPVYSEKQFLYRSPFFRSGAPPPAVSSPIIRRVFPEGPELVRGGLVIIEGNNFCHRSPRSKIYMSTGTNYHGEVSGDDIRAWTPTRIEAVVPSWAVSGSLYLDTGVPCYLSGSNLSNEIIIAVFDRPTEVPHMLKTPAAEVLPNQPLEWEWERIRGNYFPSSFFTLYRLPTQSFVHSKTLDVKDQYYRLPEEVTATLELGEEYEWRLCAFNYFENVNHCQAGRFSIIPPQSDLFPWVRVPLSLSISLEGTVLSIRAALADDRGIQSLTLAYREARAGPSVYDANSPAEGWVTLHSKRDCPQGRDYICLFDYSWPVPEEVKNGKKYQFILMAVDIGGPGRGHSGTTGDIFEAPSADFFRTRDLLAEYAFFPSGPGTDNFPMVITPLGYSYVPGDRVLVLWAEVRDDRAIQLLKFWYREAREMATAYEQSNPAEGWVLLGSSYICRGSVSCYPSYAWELPSSIDLTKSYQIIAEFFDNGVDETSGFHFGTTGDIYSQPESTWYRTRELLANPGPLAMYDPSTYCLGKPSPSIMVDYTGTCYRCLNEQVAGEVTEEVCRVARAGVCQGIPTGGSVTFEDYLCSCNAGYVTECSPYIPPNPLACSGIGVCSGSCPVGQVCIPGADNYCACQPECSGLGVCSGSCRRGYECKVADDNYCACFPSSGGPVTPPIPPTPPNPCQGKPNNTVIVNAGQCLRCVNEQATAEGETTECRAARAEVCRQTPDGGQARFERYNCACLGNLVTTCTELPQFGTCGACSSDAWGGCTPPEECRLTNDQALCQANNKPDAPCCLRDQSCAPGQRYDCGYASPNHYCDKCHRFQNYSPWCTDWQYNCGAGAPARPRLKSPANAATISETQSVALSWYAFGEGLPEKCGESIAGNWPKWEDCHGEWHWGNTPAKCISEVGVSGGNAGDRDCWGYVCARGSLGIPPPWRFYQVLVKGPADGDFREVCSLRDIPNPPGVGQGLPAEKTSCPFTPLAGGHYQWFVRAGYSTATQGGIYTNQTDSPISSFTFSIPADAFPTVSQPLRIEGSGKELTAFLTGDDDVAIEKILVHYASEGRSNWQKVVEVDCGQRHCSLSQGFTLPSDLAPGNYTFVASLWDHVIPAAGQHFGTTGANTFLSSDCTPTSTYCYSDKLRFNLAVQPPASGSPQCSGLTLDKTQAAPEDPVRVGVIGQSGSSNFKATSAITLVALRVSDNSTHGILTFSRCDGVDAKTTACSDNTQGFTPAHAQIPQAGLYKFYVMMVNQEGKTCDDFPGTPAANQCGCGAKDLTVTAPPAPDAFPTVTQALRIEGAGKDFRAMAAGEDETAIEKMVVHYALEGQANWQEVVNVSCGQRQCTLNQAFTLSQALSPGRYKFIASLWDHAVPAAGQHFGTTGANFESSDCSPTATYCHSDQLQFIVEIQPPAPFQHPACSFLSLSPQSGTFTTEFRANLSCTSGSNSFARLYLMIRKSGTTGDRIRLTPGDGLCFGQTACTTSFTFKPANFPGLGSVGAYDVWLSSRTAGPDGQLETADDGRCTDIPEGLEEVGRCQAGVKRITLTAL